MTIKAGRWVYLKGELGIWIPFEPERQSKLAAFRQIATGARASVLESLGVHIDSLPTNLDDFDPTMGDGEVHLVDSNRETRAIVLAYEADVTVAGFRDEDSLMPALDKLEQQEVAAGLGSARKAAAKVAVEEKPQK